jgi:NADH:ubiquinone oxidoreductase subunit 6 (subunit J)
LALFIAGNIFAGDLIALMYQFLNGELTSNVAIKVLVVAIVAGGLFTFYLGEMHRDSQGQAGGSWSALRIYLALTGFVVIAVAIVSVLSVPSPSTQRAVRFVHDGSSIWNVYPE